MPKTLRNSDVSKIVDNTASFRLLFKKSNESEGWIESTKAMEVPNGCLVQVSTQQINPDGSYALAEALTFVPDVVIVEDKNGGHKLFLLQ